MFSKENQVGKFGKRKKTKVQSPESALQSQCEDILKSYNIHFIRLPDSLYRSIFLSNKIEPYIKSQISKCIKGVPDLTILFENGRYVCVELKSEIGRLTPKQKEFRNAVGELNYCVIRDVDSFIKLVRMYANADV